MTSTTTTHDLTLGDGRVLHWYDTVPGSGADGPVLVWHHGTPNIGLPPAPLFGVSEPAGVRWLSYDRPGYGGSTAVEGRDIGSAAGDVAAIADAAGVGSFGVLGHSGGGPHALACAALLPDRVRAVLSLSGGAPYGAPGLDFWAGMGPVSVATFEASLAGRAERVAFEESGAGNDPDFLPADWAIFQGDWHWFMDVVGPGMANGPGPAIEDDLAFVAPWGFDPATVAVPTLLLHGGGDLVVPPGHSRWTAGVITGAELSVSDGDGHLSVLSHAPDALRWLIARS